MQRRNIMMLFLEKNGAIKMALHFDDFEALKQAFKEQEENEQAQTKARIDRIKAERLRLDQRKQTHREQQDQEKLKLLQEKEQRARAREQQQLKQVRNDNRLYRFSLFATFGSVLISAILLLVIILKY